MDVTKFLDKYGKELRCFNIWDRCMLNYQIFLQANNVNPGPAEPGYFFSLETV